MKMYIVECYNHIRDKYPCLVLTYKSRAAAVKRKNKALLTFQYVMLLETETPEV
jgi:hypothetical protein